MSSLSDILTALKNGVIGINNVAQNTRIASTTSSTVPAATTTLIYQGSGRLFNYSVVVAGSTAGAIYDSATTGGIAASNQIIGTTAALAAGVYPTNQVFKNGLVVVTGTGQSMNVTYSTGI
jgi:hypothetical protein